MIVQYPYDFIMEWSDLEWKSWCDYRAVMRERRRHEKRLAYARAIANGQYLIETRSPGNYTVWPCQHYLRRGTPQQIAEHVENRENGFGWSVTIADGLPYEYLPGLTVETARTLLSMRGFTHVQTMAGPIPIDEWLVNRERGPDWSRVRFEMIEEGKLREVLRENDHKMADVFVLPVWQAVKLS